MISGTPQVPGIYTVTVSATNSVGTATKSLTLTVAHPT
ncbi:putative Ig domain-containing protein [Nonomuraea polychroma]